MPSLCTNRPSALELIMSMSEQVVRSFGIARAHFQVDGDRGGPVDQVVAIAGAFREKAAQSPARISVSPPSSTSVTSPSSR